LLGKNALILLLLLSAHFKNIYISKF
jgi:hypothetical protein